MKNIFIVSEDKVFKKSLTDYLLKVQGPKKINYVTASGRANAISELTQKEFDAIIIDCTLIPNDLQLILKYLSTNDYFFGHIFFLSSDFSIFNEILNQINFPNINLLSLPIDPENLGNQIIAKIFPANTNVINKEIKINLDFLKIFIDNTKRVLKDFCSLEKVSHQRPYLRTHDNSIQYAVIGKIPLKSELFEGAFKIGFTEKIYLDLINKVLLLEEKEVNEEILDFAAEMVNMVYGQAKFILNDNGYNFLKVIPSFDLNPTSELLAHQHTVIVPIETEIGIIYIEILVISIKGIIF